MGDINFVYLPADGATLDPDQLSRDLYSTTAGESAYETGNGNIDAGNLATAFRVKPHMVRPWRMGDGETAGALLPLTFNQEAFGDEKYLPIAGASVTWYQHFDANVALFFGSLFVTQWRQRGPSANGAGDPTMADLVDPPPIYIRCFFDDETGIPATRRELAPTVDLRAGTTDLSFQEHRLLANEWMTCHHYNLMHGRRVNGGGDNEYTAQLQKGWRTFGIGVYIARNMFGHRGSEFVDTAEFGVPFKDWEFTDMFSTPARPNRRYPALHRAKFYVRNCTWLALR